MEQYIATLKELSGVMSEHAKHEVRVHPWSPSEKCRADKRNDGDRNETQTVIFVGELGTEWFGWSTGR